MERSLPMNLHAGRLRPAPGLLLAGVLLSVTVMFSCGGSQGQFAFRYPPDEKYRLISRSIELSDRDKVEWVYTFKQIPAAGTAGIVILKKELVPVEVSSRSENVTPDSPLIYGKLEGLQPGEYRIVITDVAAGNIQIDEREFTVYSSEENNDLPLD